MQQKAILLYLLATIKGNFFAFLFIELINVRERRRENDIIKRSEITLEINETGSSSKALCFRCKTKQDLLLFIYKSPS